MKIFRSATLRRFSIITSGKVVAAAIQAVTLGLMARTLGVDDFGRFAVMYSAILIIMSVLEFGLGNRALRVLGEGDSNRFSTTILAIRLTSNIFVTSVVALTVSYSGYLPPIWAWSIAIYTTGELFATLVQSVLIGYFRERISIFLLLSRRLIALVGATVALIWAGESDSVLMVALMFAGVFGYLSSLLAFVRHLSSPYNPFILIWRNTRFWASSLATNLQQADTLIVGSFGGDVLAGLYAAASRLTSPLNLLTGSVLQSVVPALAVEKDPQLRLRLFNRVFKVMLGYAGVLVVASALAPTVIFILYGSEFVDGWPIAIAVVVAAAANAVVQAILAWYYSVGIPRKVPVVQVMWTVMLLGSVTIGAAAGSVVIIAAGVASSAILAALVLAALSRRDLRSPSIGK